LAIYLDHNATAPLDAAVKVQMSKWTDGPRGNPSSVHGSGRRARAQVEKARRAVARSIGVDAAEITFTSGATEALHLGLRSFLKEGDHVVASAVEHPAVYGALALLGAEVTRVPCDDQGRYHTEDFLERIRPNTKLVVLMAAQNEIGNVYAVEEYAKAVAPVPLFCDAVQQYGRRSINVPHMGVQGLVVSAHKVGGPSGVGALWLPRTIGTNPLIGGGPQERGRRAGTENTLGIIGMGAAAERIEARCAEQPRLRALQEILADGLNSSIEGVIFHGDGENRLANTLNFRIEGVPGDLVLQALDLEGIEISSGSACSSGGLEPSSVLRALGLSALQARGGLRVSMGPETIQDDVEALLVVLPRIVTLIRSTGAE